MDTKMFVRKASGGYFCARDASECPGRIFWVGSAVTAANDGGDGDNPEKPFATLDYAIGKTTASASDTIFVLPGHTETLEDNDELVMDVISTRVFGLGIGTLRPTFTLSTAVDAQAVVTGANCWLDNLVFVGNLEDQAAAINASAAADGLHITNCEFRDGGTDILELVTAINIAAACDDVVIDGCRFFTTDAGSGTLAAITFVGAATRPIVRNCFFRGDWNTAPILGTAAAGFDFLVENNYINNLDAAAGLAVSLNAATTGAVVRNLAHGGLNATDPISAAGCLQAENYATNAEAASGVLSPNADDL